MVKNHVEFLQAEIAICSTFIDMAGSEIETGDREAAVRLAEKSAGACQTIERFLVRLEDAERHAEIAPKLAELQSRLEGVQARLKR